MPQDFQLLDYWYVVFRKKSVGLFYYVGLRFYQREVDDFLTSTLGEGWRDLNVNVIKTKIDRYKMALFMDQFVQLGRIPPEKVWLAVQEVGKETPDPFKAIRGTEKKDRLETYKGLVLAVLGFMIVERMMSTQQGPD